MGKKRAAILIMPTECWVEIRMKHKPGLRSQKAGVRSQKRVGVLLIPQSREKNLTSCSRPANITGSEGRRGRSLPTRPKGTFGSPSPRNSEPHRRWSALLAGTLEFIFRSRSARVFITASPKNGVSCTIN